MKRATTPSSDPEQPATQQAVDPLRGVARWARTVGFEAVDVEHLAGDLSARTYFRLHAATGATRMGVHYPDDLTAVAKRFVTTGELLTEAGLRVPQVFAASDDLRWMLLEDFGPQTLYERDDLGWPQRAPFFWNACRIIEQLQKIDPLQVEGLSPPLDRELLRSELAMTDRVFFEERALHSSSTRPLFHALADALTERLGAGPLVVCHRDFMARNLIPIGTDRLAVIDHQDTRLGPRFYDLASLLNDSLLPPPELTRSILDQQLNGPDARTDYHRSAAQRTLKAIGSFASFTARGNPKYEPLIPKMLELALGHIAQLPEAHGHHAEFAKAWLQPRA